MHTKYFKNIPKVVFYKQLVETWFNFISVTPSNTAEVYEENIFYNKHILIQGKPIERKQYFKCYENINKIVDIVNIDEATFETPQNININMRTNINVFSYNQILSAIPPEWKMKLKNPDKVKQNKIHNAIFTQRSLYKLKNKDIYLDIINRKIKTPASQTKWIERFPFLEDIDWINIYYLPYKICRDTYTQSIQYKLLHRYTNCNYNLFKWKICDSEKCSFCNFPDTVEHYFYECERVKTFWNKISIWLKSITEISISTTILEILFGILIVNDYSFLCNYIILKGKVFICTKNKTEGELFMLEFLNKLKHDISIEKEICEKKVTWKRLRKNLEFYMIIYNKLYILLYIQSKLDYL